MQKVLTAEQMREVDRLTTERYSIPSIVLMENAAHAVARVITEKLDGSVKGKSILILCGPGNNGGDGAALARILWDAEASVLVLVFGRVTDTQGDARTNFDALAALGQNNADSAHDPADLHDHNDHESLLPVLDLLLSECDVAVDSMFGTGVTRELSGVHAEAIRLLDTCGKSIISVDMPSGLNADCGSPIGPCVSASATVTFTAPKAANVVGPASSFNGDLTVESIGSPRELVDEQPSQLFVAERGDAAEWLAQTEFSPDSFKKRRGHAVMIVGSESYSGAAVLAGDAAMRSGVGLVTVVTPKSSKDSVAARIIPEVMVRGVAETKGGSISETAIDEIGDLLEKADSVAIGCGLSQDADTKHFVEKLIHSRRQPVVVDADALNLLSPFTGENRPDVKVSPDLCKEGSYLILTPHEGEFMRLLGTDDKDAVKDRVAAVRDFAVKNNVILVLKGERVLIGSPDGRVVVNPTGNSGLGKAGNGDTLTGILAGFMAQAATMNIDIFETVVAAVYVAGMAGDIAEKKYGKRVMTASDVRECLTDVFNELSQNDK